MPLKQDILTALEQNREADLSGQWLAQRYGVSRNAVWKAVNALKAEGFDIASAPNRGYRLSPECDLLSETGIRAQLEAPTLPLHTLDMVDSTNSEAKRLLAGGATGPFLITANGQTAGRGRHGRTFFSPKDAGLYMTVALTPHMPAEWLLNMTAYAAVCVAEAIERLTGASPRIKWVNDLFVDGRKVCGILTEAVTDFESGTVESLLVGIGINLRQSDVPDSLREVVGFLNVTSPVRNRLVAAITNALLRYTPQDHAFWDAYRERSLTIGRRVQCTQGNRSFTGMATAIDESGALVVLADCGDTGARRSGEAILLPQ